MKQHKEWRQYVQRPDGQLIYDPDQNNRHEHFMLIYIKNRNSSHYLPERDKAHQHARRSGYLFIQ